MKRIRTALCTALLLSFGIQAFAQGGFGGFGGGRGNNFGGFGGWGGQARTPGIVRGGQQNRQPANPTTRPGNTPTTRPGNTPTTQPGNVPTTRPTTQPGNTPTNQPGNVPTSQQGNVPTTRPPVSGPGRDNTPKRASGAGQYDTAAFMAGEIYVNVVLFESNGKIDPDTENWSKAEIGKVVDHVKKACAWWEEMWKRKNYIGKLHFTLGLDYADTPFRTSYEPVTHGAMRDDRLWIGEFLNSLGYTGDKNRMLYQYTNDTIEKHKADFAFSIFIVKADNDPDHYFADSFRSYAWGSQARGCSDTYILTAYSRSYDWYSTQSFAHEMAHIFGALDEYPGQGRYTDIGGYYGVQNTNAPDGNPNRNAIVPSLMNGSVSSAVQNYTSSPQSLEMIGWRDSDGDRIIDVLDAPIDVTDFSSKMNLSDPTYEFTGTFTARKVPNHNNTKAITVNSVDRLLYRNGESGEWKQVNDKDWGEKSKTVSHQFKIPKNSVLQWKVVDATGTAESKTYTVGTVRNPKVSVDAKTRSAKFTFTPATPDAKILRYRIRVDRKTYEVGDQNTYTLSDISNGTHTWAIQGVLVNLSVTDWLPCGSFTMPAN